jgi:hypothetical protein
MSLNFKSCDTRSCKVSFFGSAGGALRIGIEGPPITTNGQEADRAPHFAVKPLCNVGFTFSCG